MGWLARRPTHFYTNDILPWYKNGESRNGWAMSFNMMCTVLHRVIIYKIVLDIQAIAHVYYVYLNTLYVARKHTHHTYTHTTHTHTCTYAHMHALRHVVMITILLLLFWCKKKQKKTNCVENLDMYIL